MFPAMATIVSDPALRAELAHGLSDPSRQRILELLRDGERRTVRAKLDERPEQVEPRP